MSGQTTKHRVIVVGGGYAGTLAANRLRKREHVDIRLVNPRPMFVNRIRLHQYVAGSDSATADYASLLGKDVGLVVDSATYIDTANRTLSLASGRELGYDYLIYGVGSTAAIPASVPGAVEHAVGIGEWEAAQRVHSALEYLPISAPITVIGGGLTGIETAAELAETGRRITLICHSVLGSSLSASTRRSVLRWMSRREASVVECATVNEVRPDSVVLADGTRRASALTIWAAGFGVPGLASGSGIRTDEMGRMLTDETLTSIDDLRVVAAGDAAAPSGAPLRMSCQSAGPLGAQAADTVLSRIAGAEPNVIDFAFTGSCVSLGRKAAVRQFARKDDSALNLHVGGRIAAVYKELTCKAGIMKIRFEARRPGSLPWPKGGPRPVGTIATSHLGAGPPG